MVGSCFYCVGHSSNIMEAACPPTVNQNNLISTKILLVIVLSRIPRTCPPLEARPFRLNLQILFYEPKLFYSYKPLDPSLSNIMARLLPVDRSFTLSLPKVEVRQPIRRSTQELSGVV